jgi:hypothetical protein
MERWWIYEMPSAQAAYEAVFDRILNYSHDEVTGLGAGRARERMIVITFTSSRGVKIHRGQSRGSTNCSTLTVAGPPPPCPSSWRTRACSSTDPVTG